MSPFSQTSRTLRVVRHPLASSPALCRCLALLLLLVLSVGSPVSAGYYAVTYSGGVMSCSSLPGPQPYLPVGTNYDRWGGGHAVFSTTSGGVFCQGTIRAHFEWENDEDPEDVAPQAAVVAEYGTAYASWGGDIPEAYATIDAHVNMANFRQTNNPENPRSYSEEGWNILVKYSENGEPLESFDVYCTPVASVAGGAPMGYGMSGGAGVSYKALAAPAVVSLRGVTKNMDEKYILVGQRCEGALSVPGFSVTNHQWNVNDMDNTTFWKFEVAGDKKRGEGKPVEPGEWQKEKPKWVWKKDNEATVTCTAITSTVLEGIPMTTEITAMEKVKVQAPVYTFLPRRGGVYIYKDSTFFTQNPVPWIVAAFQSSPQRQGMTFDTRVTTPPNYRGINGVGDAGELQFVQVTKIGRWSTSDNQTLETPSIHNHTGGDLADLDKQYPYNVYLGTAPPGKRVADGLQLHNHLC